MDELKRVFASGKFEIKLIFSPGRGFDHTEYLGATFPCELSFLSKIQGTIKCIHQLSLK